MGEVRHLPFELLSALQDGEIQGQDAVAAREHLRTCPACQAEAASLARLEDELALPPVLSCEAAAPFLSARQDGEADRAAAALAERHLAACAVCSAAVATWAAAEQLIAATVLPSVRTDAAMAALVRTAPAPRAPRGTGALRGFAFRGTVAGLVAIAIAFGSTLASGPGDVATPSDEPALVAAVQQVVLDRRTNTLYVAEPASGTVNALNASDHSVRARIVVGGRPTALALNETTNRIIVLDAGAKRFTEIDTDRNTVVGSTAIEVAGVPTSVQVENGKIVVFTAVAAKSPTASAVASPASGQVAVFDPGTKQLETVRSVDVAPRLVVADPNGQRTLLVSAQATTIADASYRTIETIAGGVSAAFGRADRIAVLAADGDGARLTFHGENAPASVRLAGRAAAVIGLPDGGFAVLVDLGGRGRIELVDASGRATGGIDVAVAGRDLAFDATSGRFTVVGGGQVASASLPGAVAAVPSTTPAVIATASARPTPSATPAPSATPTPTISAPPTASAAPSAVAGVPAGATQVGQDLYRVGLAGRVLVLSASGSGRVWFIDQRNQLAAVDTSTGAVYTVAQLPADAVIRGLAVGNGFVYAVDVARGRLFELAIQGERLASYGLPVADVAAITVAPEGTVWVSMPGSPHLLAFDRTTGRFQAINVGVRGAVALAADVGGRLWFSDGVATIGAYDASEAKVLELAWPGRTAPTVLLPDASGRVWAGTASGEIFLLSGRSASTIAGVGRPVTMLTLDSSGRPWYLAPAPSGPGFVFGPLDRSQPPRLVAGAVTSLGFGRSANAWLADPAGGFYIAIGSR